MTVQSPEAGQCRTLRSRPPSRPAAPPKPPALRAVLRAAQCSACGLAGRRARFRSRRPSSINVIELRSRARLRRRAVARPPSAATTVMTARRLALRVERSRRHRRRRRRHDRVGHCRQLAAERRALPTPAVSAPVPVLAGTTVRTSADAAAAPVGHDDGAARSRTPSEAARPTLMDPPVTADSGPWPRIAVR